MREARDSVRATTRPSWRQQDYIKTVQSLSNVARQVVPPATRLEHKLYPWVYFGILPLFALTNADVSFVGRRLGGHVLQPGALRRVLRPFGGQARGHHAVQLHRGEAESGLAASERQLDTHAGCGHSGRRGIHHGHLRGEPGVCRRAAGDGREAGHPVRLASGRRARVRLFVPAGTRREKAWRGVPDHRFRRRMLADRRRGGGAPGGEAVGRDRKPASERGDHRREARERRGGSGGRSGGGRDAQRRIGRRGRRRRGHVGHGRERNGREVPWKQQPSCWRRVQEPA